MMNSSKLQAHENLNESLYQRILELEDQNQRLNQQLTDAYASIHSEKLKRIRYKELFYKSFQLNPTMNALISVETGRFLDINIMWEEFTGYSKPEIINKTIEEVLGTDECFRNTLLVSSIKNYKETYRTKDGKLRNGIFSSDIIELKDERQVMLVGVDVTEIDNLNEELVRLDRLNLIGQMAAGISHEIRNPMTTVRGFLQLMRNRDKYADDISNFDLLISELDRANQIISEFLALSWNRKQECMPYKLNYLINIMIPLIQSEAWKEGKQVQFRLTDVPNTLIDQTEFRQLLLNLTKNGFDAMKENDFLTIGTYHDHNYVYLSVKDQGKGIPEHIIAKLGTPFFTTKEKGTGLGLAICYSIVKRSGGNIKVKTGDGGTEFLASFPIVVPNKL